SISDMACACRFAMAPIPMIAIFFMTGFATIIKDRLWHAASIARRAPHLGIHTVFSWSRERVLMHYCNRSDSKYPPQAQAYRGILVDRLRSNPVRIAGGRRIG